jgi:hypothetical protein
MSSVSSSLTVPVSAYTEQPTPLPESSSANSLVPQGMWIVLILAFILLVLLAWWAIDEMVDGPGGSDDSGNWFPPL